MTRNATSPAIFILTLSCPNRPGIVAAISQQLYELGANITEAQQFDDTDSNRFFMRIVFEVTATDNIGQGLRTQITRIADTFSMEWSLTDTQHRQKVLLLVSRFDHCLVDLLYRWRIGELPIDPVGIISNHPRETFADLDFYGIPFHYLPVTKETKAAQEEQIWTIFNETGAELAVLARYMQVLSNAMASRLSGRCINIHHS
ncbi:MAG: formyltransferase family protein, partial [Komagataeibacter saccharivorans]|uniref:formyltetrahydrofolate deformylase n=2 Tax=Acetobacteraceae TaxID=433 RepID=UPI0039E9FF66